MYKLEHKGACKMKTDLTRSLIETSVRRALNQGGEAPERESRNLVDLGL